MRVAAVCLLLATPFTAASDLRETLLSTLPLDATGQPIALPDEAALERTLAANVDEHRSEAAATCEHFHCAPPDGDGLGAESFDAYPMAPVPSIDFPSTFAERDVIYVSKAPFFSPAECEDIIRLAELEGDGLPSTKSGKYQIGKAWIKDMPSVRAWFNKALSHQLFPTLSKLFPELLPEAKELRAHSVAILKYNASHSQTDVHVDDALFAFTIALSDASSFEGGGTYFEHLGRTVDMAQGHATFRPGSVRHAGSAVSAGVRYVVGGFIAVADKVEHVRRLNERGNKILLSSPDPMLLMEAERLFKWGLLLNANCSLCHQNLGDTYLRLDQPAQAEESLRQQIQLLPRDSDAYFALGNALRGQARQEDALAAYTSAVAITPTDYESHVGRADCLNALERPLEEIEAYRNALAIRPTADVRLWINIGVAYSGGTVDDVEQAEAAFRMAVEIAPSDARPALNLGRYLAKLSRPAEAIEQFYAAAVIDAEYFDEVKLGVGTARAQQGRLKEATEAFESASRMSPKNEKLKSSLGEMSRTAAEVALFTLGLSNAVDDLCGTPCQDVVDGSGVWQVCGISWSDGCGEETPPDGFTAASKVSELCALSCAFYTHSVEVAQRAKADATAKAQHDDLVAAKATTVPERAGGAPTMRPVASSVANEHVIA